MIKWKLVAALCALSAPSGAMMAQSPAAGDRRAPPRLISGSISNMDYPAAAIRAREQGTVRMRISIDASGAITGCEVTTSSGSQALDERSCTVARERFTFAPGRNAAGEAAASTYVQSVRWVMPEPDEGMAPFAPTIFAVTATVEAGQITACVFRVNGQEPPVPLEVCRGLFTAYPIWESLRGGLAGATHVYAFTPQGSPLPAYQPEWGELHGQSETDIIIGPDGRATGCAPAGESNFSQCTSESDHVEPFEPSSGPERRGRITSALFTVTRR